MVQRGRSAGFSSKAFQNLRVARNISWQELEGDVPAKFEVFSLVHYTHPARANLFQNAVMRNGAPNHKIALPQSGDHGKAVFNGKSTRVQAAEPQPFTS